MPKTLVHPSVGMLAVHPARGRLMMAVHPSVNIKTAKDLARVSDPATRGNVMTMTMTMRHRTDPTSIRPLTTETKGTLPWIQS